MFIRMNNAVEAVPMIRQWRFRHGFRFSFATALDISVKRGAQKSKSGKFSGPVTRVEVDMVKVTMVVVIIVKVTVVETTNWKRSQFFIQNRI